MKTTKALSSKLYRVILTGSILSPLIISIVGNGVHASTKSETIDFGEAA